MRKTSVHILFGCFGSARNITLLLLHEIHKIEYNLKNTWWAMMMQWCTWQCWRIGAPSEVDVHPPPPLPKKKLMHPLWNPCRPQSLLCIPCPASFFVGLDQPWFEVASLVHPIWDVPALGPRRPLVYFLLPDYRNSDQICKSKCIFVMLMHSSLLATLSIKMGSSPSIHLLLLCYLHLWCYF